MIKTSIATPTPDHWVDVIAETENVLSVSKAGNYLFAQYIKDATSMIQQYDFSGKKGRDITLPEVGTAEGFSGKKSQQQVYYSFSNQKHRVLFLN